MKKSMSILLALLLCLNLSVMAFAADTCFVAGTPELCGSSWQMSDPNNAMTLNGTVYEKVYPNVPVGDYQFKVVYNGEWKGNGNDNVMFSVTSPCDVTITYDPATGNIGYSGNGVGKTALKVTDIYVVGAKADNAPNWLHGENWNEKADNNRTDVTVSGVYSISFEDIPAGTYEFKFAADKAWTHSWGGTFTEFETPTDAVYNGSNISFTLAETAKVTLELDLRNFDLATGGAKFAIRLNTEPDPTEPTDPTDPTEPSTQPTEPSTQPTQPSNSDETYYVAGCEELCGVFWKENDPQSKMTKGADGIYTKTYKNVPAGTYQIKVTDGTWTNSWGGNGPDGNFEFTTTQTGDVTVKFDPATKVITVYMPGGGGTTPPTTTAPAGPKYYVSGSGAALGNWDAAFSKGLMSNVAPDTYRITFGNLPAGEYEFKITDGTWNVSYGDNGGNYKFKLDKPQKVTIIFKLVNGQHSVQWETGSPITADFTMFPLVAAVLCATMGACLLLMSRKKII